MADLTVRGSLRWKGETVSVGSNNFEKREFSLLTDEQYPQIIMFELQQGKVIDIDPFQINEKMSVSFNLRGREWVNPQSETKVFNTLVAWKLTHDTTPGQTPQQPQQQNHAQAPTAPAPVNNAAPAPASPTKSAAQIEAEKIGYVHTHPQFTLDQMMAANWTFEALVANGYGHIADDLPF